MAQQSSIVDVAKASLKAYSEKNWDALRDLCAPGIVYEEFATHRKIQGVDNFLKTLQQWATAFPDSKATIHNAYVSGNTVVLEITWRGTHKGPLATPGGQIAPTGKTTEVPACQVFEIEHGKGKLLRHYFDMATLMQQLGIAKAA